MSAIPSELGYTRRSAAGATTGDVVPVPGLPAEPMPRLSAEVPLHDLSECNECGDLGSVRDPLAVWQECDEADVSEDIYLVLCRRCSDRLIPDHPRLYHRMVRHQPAPGAMPICTNCRWHAGTLCQHPRSKARGGPGVRLDGPGAQWTSMQVRGAHGRREHRTGILYVGPVWGCDQKVLNPSRA